MCWDCDHPDATHADFLDHMRGLIRRHGWAIQGVEGDGVHPPWTYTVGLTAYGDPELVVTGMDLVPAAALLNKTIVHLGHSPRLSPGDQFRLPGQPLVEVVQLTDPTAHLYTAMNIYGLDLRALQLVYADSGGRWPWDAEFRGGQGGQPVLGIRSR